MYDLCDLRDLYYMYELRDLCDLCDLYYLYDLYDLVHVDGREPYDLHETSTCCLGLGSVLCRSCTSSHTGG